MLWLLDSLSASVLPASGRSRHLAAGLRILFGEYRSVVARPHILRRMGNFPSLRISTRVLRIALSVGWGRLLRLETLRRALRSPQ